MVAGSAGGVAGGCLALLGILACCGVVMIRNRGKVCSVNLDVSSRFKLPNGRGASRDAGPQVRNEGIVPRVFRGLR